MIRKICLLIPVFIILYSCDDAEDENPIETVLEVVERGAVLRTTSINNGEFDITNPQSVFNIDLEESDIEDGALMSSMDVFLSFIDNTIDGNNSSVNRFLFKTYLPENFQTGANGLPVISIDYTFVELLEATAIDVSSVACKDQFRIDIDLNLTDGRTFNTRNSAGTIVNNSGSFNSPFTYLINIVEPIPTDSFIGVYQMEQIEDGFFENSFTSPIRMVEVFNGHSNNVRIFRFIEENAGTFSVEFSIVCDVAIMTRYQKIEAPSCNSHDISDRILLGPDNPPGIANSEDDTVFELYFLEGFEGYNTGCDFTDFPAKIRLSKQ